MKTDNHSMITVETTVNAPVELVWKYWSVPKHIIHWNSASDDWHTPFAENDLRTGGKLLWRMEAKNGSFGFDFSGVYDEVKLNEFISYTLDDGRKVSITFKPQENKTRIIEIFEAEEENSLELQKNGWQAILEHFKNYAEQTTDR
ncbi:SRPBCC domain-containing protein [Acetobacterium bakii]|uniref:Polyketide cyclase n=1 Tax=Acetobacterium bakii TaxID=52689 RepID=A0A0L6TXS2_9FIRM|nr:SRPBCC domain-containing protein [Acetobacterium bakii]KNZ40355.1 polyketide cyclase [Acetobacterium bakii]